MQTRNERQFMLEFNQRFCLISIFILFFYILSYIDLILLCLFNLYYYESNYRSFLIIILQLPQLLTVCLVFRWFLSCLTYPLWIQFLICLALISCKFISVSFSSIPRFSRRHLNLKMYMVLTLHL